MSDPIHDTAICPKCNKTLKKFTIMNTAIKTSCADCGVIWSPEFEFDYDTEDILEEKLTNKQKREQKDKVAEEYIDLMNRIEQLTIITDIEMRHAALKEIDDEFSYMAPKKYNAYFELTDFYEDLNNDNYDTYLNSRIKKMIKDIHKILFYFGK
jgi:hypothetical protein